MKLTFLPPSARLLKGGYRLVLPAVALLIVVSMVGVGLLAHALVGANAKGAHGSSSALAANDLGGSSNPTPVILNTPGSPSTIDSRGGNSQEWAIQRANTDNGTYYIRNDNGCLDVDGPQVVIVPCQGGPDQQWFLQSLPPINPNSPDPAQEHVYNIFNWGTGLFLDVMRTAIAPGVRVIQSAFDTDITTNASQQWILQPAGNEGSYNIFNINGGSGLCLDNDFIRG